MGKLATIMEEENKEIHELYRIAVHILCIQNSDILRASVAWNNVSRKMKELGEKYHFDPKNVKVTVRGEVFPIGEVI